MKLYVCEAQYALKNEMKLMKLRTKGNMVCIYSPYNRQFMSRNYYRLANVFIADRGLFAYSGCHVLNEKKPEALEKVTGILNEQDVSYSFALEDDQACGGQIPYASNGKNVSNESFTYALSFEEAGKEESVRKLLEPYCSFEEQEGITGLVFQDASIQDALEKVRAELEPEAVMFLDEEGEHEAAAFFQSGRL